VNLLFKDSQGLYIRVTQLEAYKGSYKISAAHYMVDGEQPSSEELALLNAKHADDLQWAGEVEAEEQECLQSIERYYYKQLAMHYQGTGR
jgi:hypothetical protein